MKFIQCKDYNEMSVTAASIIAEEMKKNPSITLGLATGSTPIGMYRDLIRRYNDGEIDFAAARSFNLDEYYPISHDNPQSYHYFMNENLFSHINLPKDKIAIPDGAAADPDAECARYEAAIDAAGGIDLQVLGIGENGHIGFNEPGDFLYADTHKTGLTESTINANARFFNSADEVPRHALTTGIGTIMRARKILLLISGAAKKKALKMLRDNDHMVTEVPATFLKAHSDVIVIFDDAAAEA